MFLAIASLPVLLQAAVITVFLAVVSMTLGLMLGLLSALASISKIKILNRMSLTYISIVRGTPLLVLIYVVYYGLPQIGITLSPLPSGIVALSVHSGAYLSECFRAAIQSVDRGQSEAAYSLGMTYAENMRRIILPQSIRTALPTIGNTFIGLLKDTSLVSVITVTELLQAAQLIIARTFQPLLFYIEAGLIYWLLSTAFSVMQAKIEQRATRHLHR